MNNTIPVCSICLKIPFHDASMQYCCFVVNGDRGSAGGGGRSMSSWLNSEAASFVNWQPIFEVLGVLRRNIGSDGKLFFFLLIFIK